MLGERVGRVGAAGHVAQANEATSSELLQEAAAARNVREALDRRRIIGHHHGSLVVAPDGNRLAAELAERYELEDGGDGDGDGRADRGGV